MDPAKQKLFYASPLVIKAFKVAEPVLRSELEKYWLEKKNFFDFVCIEICNNLVSIYFGLFRNMDSHCYELLKSIRNIYVSFRFKRRKLRNKKEKVALLTFYDYRNNNFFVTNRFIL